MSIHMVAFKKYMHTKRKYSSFCENFLLLSDWLEFVSGLAHSALQHCVHMLVVRNCAGFL